MEALHSEDCYTKYLAAYSTLPLHAYLKTPHANSDEQKSLVTLTATAVPQYVLNPS